MDLMAFLRNHQGRLIYQEKVDETMISIEDT